MDNFGIYEFLTLIFLCITAAATSIYAYLSWKMAEPLISIMIEPDRFDELTMNLVIENVGQGPA